MAEKKKNKQQPQQATKVVSEQSTSIWLYLAPVLILTFILYSNTFKNYFIINWDDDGYIINNPMLKDFSWKSIVFMFSHFHLDNYHPLTTLSNAIEYHLFKLNAKPYHFNNLVLHLLNTTLVFYFIKQLIKNKEAAILAALLFAIHPMHVESVTWISERKDLLYTAFFLLSLITYNRFIQEEKKSLLLWSVVFMLLSCLSKPAAVALTPVLFLLDYYAGKKIDLASILQKLPFLFLSLLFGIIALITQSNSGSMSMVAEFSFIDKFFFVCYGLAFYIVKLFAPMHLSSMYLYPIKENGLLPMEYYLAPILIIALVVLVIRSKKIQKELIFGLLFYFFTLAMVIQVVPVGKAIVAERYSYVPYIGLFLIFSRLYIMVKNNDPDSYRDGNGQKQTSIMYGVIATFIVIFCVTTWNRNKDWKDSYTLFSSYIEIHPDNYYGYYARGVGRTLQNDTKGAIEDYSQAIKVDPEHDFLWYNRGVEFEKIKDLPAAIADYTEAVKINPKHSKSYYNRGNLKFMSGDMNAAINDYTTTISLDSAHAEAYCNRAIAYLNLKDTAKAMTDLTASLQQNPKLMNALNNRGALYFAQKNMKAACQDYSVAAKEGNENAQKILDYYCK